MIFTLPDGRELTLPNITFAVMGHPGSGKSHLCASMPKPLLVLATDPMQKLFAYFERGKLRPEAMKSTSGQPIRIIDSKVSGKPIIQIEGYYDATPGSCAMQDLMNRVERLTDEVNAGMWASVALDSWSGMEDIAVQRRQKGVFAVANNDGRAAYASAKDDCKSLLNTRLIHLNCNVGMVFHISEKAVNDGQSLMKSVKVIGDLAPTIGRLVAERYRSEVGIGGKRILHTQPDNQFHLCTLIDAPEPCDNVFPALFANYITRHEAEATTPVPVPTTPAGDPQQKEQAAS